MCWTLALPVFQYSIPTHWALYIIALRSQCSDLSVSLKGLKKEQKKEIYFLEHVTQNILKFKKELPVLIHSDLGHLDLGHPALR